VDNSVGTFLPADPVTLSLIGRAYELRDVKFGFLESSSASSGSDVQASPSGNVDIQPENSTTVNSGRGFEVVASFQLIWWNQGSSSRNKLSIWRPVVPHGMVYFGDIAVTGYVL
jgi:vacuolar protein sorting-associated protein 13A/C